MSLGLVGSSRCVEETGVILVYQADPGDRADPVVKEQEEKRPLGWGTGASILSDILRVVVKEPRAFCPG